MLRAVALGAALGMAASLLVGAFALAQADGYSKIEAQFQVIGKDAIDPPPNQKRDRVALFLHGPGARKIYDAMPVAAVRQDACEQGLKVKRSGALECWEARGEHSCRVAILLNSGQTRAIDGC